MVLHISHGSARHQPKTQPGPPAEKDPPPPIRNCRTVTAVLPFTSFQPPGYSNASMACVKSAGLYCLHVPAACLSNKPCRGAVSLVASGPTCSNWRAQQRGFPAYLKSPPMYCDSGALLLPPVKPSSSGCARPTSSFCMHTPAVSEPKMRHDSQEIFKCFIASISGVRGASSGSRNNPAPGNHQREMMLISGTSYQEVP